MASFSAQRAFFGIIWSRFCLYFEPARHFVTCTEYVNNLKPPLPELSGKMLVCKGTVGQTHAPIKQGLTSTLKWHSSHRRTRTRERTMTFSFHFKSQNENLSETECHTNIIKNIIVILLINIAKNGWTRIIVSICAFVSSLKDGVSKQPYTRRLYTVFHSAFESSLFIHDVCYSTKTNTGAIK